MTICMTRDSPSFIDNQDGSSILDYYVFLLFRDYDQENFLLAVSNFYVLQLLYVNSQRIFIINLIYSISKRHKS